jgi:hypothetical protein
VPTFGYRRVHRGQPEGEDDDADHLQHRQQAVDPVVRVVRRGEPAEVDPRPADGECREGESSQTGTDVVLGELVGELGRRDAEPDHECEVEQQLERRGRSMQFVGIAARHLPDPVHLDPLGAVRLNLAHDLESLPS